MAVWGTCGMTAVTCRTMLSMSNEGSEGEGGSEVRVGMGGEEGEGDFAISERRE